MRKHISWGDLATRFLPLTGWLIEVRVRCFSLALFSVDHRVHSSSRVMPPYPRERATTLRAPCPPEEQSKHALNNVAGRARLSVRCHAHIYIAPSPRRKSKCLSSSRAPRFLASSLVAFPWSYILSLIHPSWQQSPCRRTPSSLVLSPRRWTSPRTWSNKA